MPSKASKSSVLRQARKVSERNYVHPIDIPPFREWAKENLWIVPRGAIEGESLPAVKFDRWRAGQERLGEYFEFKRRDKEPINCVIHKSRQVTGASTLCQGFLLHLIKFNPGKRALVMAHEFTATQTVFLNVRTFIQHLPEDQQLNLKGGTVTDKGLVCLPPHNSSIELLTASGSVNIARAKKIDYMHKSESDFWPRPKEIMQGLGPTLVQGHESWDCVLMDESTAVGKRYFYHRCQLAQNPKSKIDFFFLGWPDEEYCRIPLTVDEQTPGHPNEFKPDERELELQKEHNLELPQVKWMRITKEDQCDNYWEVFFSEYPLKSEDAFLYSGYPVFNPEIIDRYLKEIEGVLAVR